MVFYLQGMDILQEINALWNAVRSANSKANSAYSKAKDAYAIAKDNSGRISLMEADIQNNTVKIYLIKDELVAFENDYILFKNQTRINITRLSANITILSTEVGNNTNNIKMLNERLIDSSKLFVIAILVNYLVSLSIVTYLVVTKIKRLKTKR